MLNRVKPCGVSLAFFKLTGWVQRQKQVAYALEQEVLDVEAQIAGRESVFAPRERRKEGALKAFFLTRQDRPILLDSPASARVPTEDSLSLGFCWAPPPANKRDHACDAFLRHQRGQQ